MRNSRFDAILIVVLGVALVLGAFAFIRAQSIGVREAAPGLNLDMAGEVYEERMQQTNDLLRVDNAVLGAR